MKGNKQRYWRWFDIGWDETAVYCIKAGVDDMPRPPQKWVGSPEEIERVANEAMYGDFSFVFKAIGFLTRVEEFKCTLENPKSLAGVCRWSGDTRAWWDRDGVSQPWPFKMPEVKK